MIAAAAVLLAAALVVDSGPASRLARGRSRLPVPLGRPPGGRGTWWVAAGPTAGLAVGVNLHPTATVAASMVVVAAALRHRRRRAERRRRSEGTAMAAALEILVGELAVGAHPMHAFTAAADESAGRVAEGLRAVAARARLGADVVGGLMAAGTGSAVPAYWCRLAAFWKLAAEHGLPMVALVRAAQRDIVERHRFTERLDAGLAGARATAAILAGLPLLGVALGELVGARPVAFLLGGAPGGYLLIVGTALAAAGMAWSDRIIGRLSR